MRARFNKACITCKFMYIYNEAVWAQNLILANTVISLLWSISVLINLQKWLLFFIVYRLKVFELYCFYGIFELLLPLLQLFRCIVFLILSFLIGRMKREIFIFSMQQWQESTHSLIISITFVFV